MFHGRQISVTPQSDITNTIVKEEYDGMGLDLLEKRGFPDGRREG